MFDFKGFERNGNQFYYLEGIFFPHFSQPHFDIKYLGNERLFLNSVKSI